MFILTLHYLKEISLTLQLHYLKEISKNTRAAQDQHRQPSEKGYNIFSIDHIDLYRELHLLTLIYY